MRIGQCLGILLLIGISATAGATIGSRIAGATPAQDQGAKNIAIAKLQKWEYRLVDSNNAVEAEKVANRLGEEGFELFNHTNNGTIYHMAFRRLKP